MISLLIPSKNRLASLKYCLEHNWQALKGHKFETLVRCHANDQWLANYQKAAKPFRFKLFIEEDGDGYQNLHIMYNQLAAQAKGDWLWLLADDAYISSFPASMPDGTQEISVISNDPELDKNYFPMLSRKAYDLLGHFSMAPHIDTYLAEMGDALGIHKHIPGIEVFNMRDDIDDEVTAQKNSVIHDTSAEHWQEPIRTYLQEDIERLKPYVQNS